MPAVLNSDMAVKDRMGYSRGSNDLYDYWAKVTDDPGWSWASLEPYYFKVLMSCERHGEYSLSHFT